MTLDDLIADICRWIVEHPDDEHPDIVTYATDFGEIKVIEPCLPMQEAPAE